MRTRMKNMGFVSAVAFAVCTVGTVAGAGNVRVVDCKGREFSAPTCMTEERIFKAADKEFTNGGVKVLGLDLRIQKCTKAALEKHADAEKVEFATALVLDAKSGAIRGAAEVRGGHEPARLFRYADALTWNYEPGGLIYPVIAALAAKEGQEWESLGSALASGRGEVFEELRKKDILSDWSDWKCSLKSAVARGESIRLCSLQIARSYAVLANLGVFTGSYGVERMVGADGKVLKCHEQTAVQRVLDAEIAVKVCRAMEKSVAKGGFCQDANVDGLRVAGMSGTASLHFEPKSQMVVNGQSFAGFFPAENPCYVVVVTFVSRKDEPMVRGGGRAARAFAEIARMVMANE